MSESTIFLDIDRQNQVDFSGSIHIKISKMPIGLGVEKTMELSCNPSMRNAFKIKIFFLLFLIIFTCFFFQLTNKTILHTTLNGVDQI